MFTHYHVRSYFAQSRWEHHLCDLMKRRVWYMSMRYLLGVLDRYQSAKRTVAMLEEDHWAMREYINLV